KKYGIYYKLSDNDDIGKELDEYSKLINDAIKKAKENE
ncbi:TPA: ankyrin repeat domain-containing protein, partial [Campylobacter jejuni]|nr:ankyrin repeat domain-containing protein [Campylobacter jejuni]